MLYWICPECGRDCSPAVRECPVCAQQHALVTEGVLALVQNFQSAPPVPLLAAAPQQILLFAANGHPVQATDTVAAVEEEPAVPAGDAIDSLVRPLVESAETPTRAEPVVDSTATAPAQEIQPTLPFTESSPVAPQVETAAKPEQVKSPGQSVIEASETAPSASALASPPVEPRNVPSAERPVAPLIEPVEVKQSAGPASESTAATAPTALDPPVQATEAKTHVEPAKPVAAEPKPEPPVESTRPTQPAEPAAAASPVATPEPTCDPGALSQALELQAETLLDALAVQIEAHESRIREVAASFETRPKMTLLTAPPNMVTAPAPPSLEWMRTPKPAIPARKPADPRLAALTAPPQTPPLAGPSLPPELRNFIQEPPSASARSAKPVGLPAWIISLVIATALFLGVGALLQYMGSRDTKPASVPAPQSSQPASSAPAAPAFEPHPFAKFVEVTGLRVVADQNHRSQVQYIVVNHSSEQLTGMVIRIAVRSASAPANAAPLFKVSAVVPSLGPHQSKEIRTDLDSELRSTAVPDWENLRTDVQVGTLQ